MRTRGLFALALLAALAGCDEVFSPDSGRDTSSVTFSYSPFGTWPGGSYRAEGEVPIENGGYPFGDWAFAFRTGPATEPVIVEASRTAADGRFDVLTLLLPNNAHGGKTLRLGQTDCVDPEECAPMSVDFGFDVKTLEAETECAAISGTLNLKTLTNRRAVCTFSGVLRCPGEHAGQTQVQGTFNVAVLER